jgi:hypothetical protein
MQHKGEGMFKKTAVSAVVVFVMLLMPLTAGASGSLPGSGWWSSASVQNVGSADGTVQMSVYDTASPSTFTSSDFALPMGQQVTIMPSDFTGLSAGFQGSGVVSSNQPAVAVGHVANYQFLGLGTAGGKASARYQGMNAPATTLYSPIAKNNWFGLTTLFYIQNAGSSAATATVVFNMGLSSPATYTFTTASIAPGQMAVVSPADAGVPNGPSNNSTQINLGTMVVSSAQPLAGTYVEYRVAESVATTISSMRLMAASDFDDKAFGPSIKHNWFNRFMGIAILNTSGGSINATINYVGTQGACAGSTFQDVVSNIAPNRRGSIILGAGGTTNFPANCVGTAVVSATGNFVATVNESNTSGTPTSGNVSYMLPEVSSTTKVAAPTFFDQRNGFSSGFQVQNVGASATNITATFYCKGAGSANTPFTAVSNAINVNPGSSFLFFRPKTTQAGQFATPFAQSNSVCSVMVTSSSQNIVGLMNTISDVAGQIDDSKYEAFSLAP